MSLRKLRNKIGRKIKALRTENRISQEKLAEFVDISREHISCLERGKHSANIGTLYKIAEYFNVDIKDFF